VARISPEFFQWVADVVDPVADPTVVTVRISDHVIYWLAYLHFGRINGIGIPCHGPGVCDQATKAVWAFFGLAPALLAVTGAIVWWNRLRRPRSVRVRRVELLKGCRAAIDGPIVQLAAEKTKGSSVTIE
jgi:uncharacterized iron-regulated membrane protein